MSVHRALASLPVSVPAPLAEAGNGLIVPLLAVVILAMLAYVVEYWWFVRYSYEWPWAWRPVWMTYLARKPAIAALFFLTGFELRIFSVWLPMHLTNHGVDPGAVLPAGGAPLAYLVGTVFIVLGLTCWLRVTLPDKLTGSEVQIGTVKLRVGRVAWAAIVVACAWWAVWMAS